MARIAIIGSGIAGLLTAHGLRRGGHEVTVYSDRSGEQWITSSKPTGSAARFDRSLSYDRELGLAFWEDHPARMFGASMVLCPRPRNQLLTLVGRLSRPALAVDVRRLSERWMAELEKRGGRVVLGQVGVADLDEIAGRHDLTVVAVGKADLCRLFEANPARNPYDKPQRNLAMVVTRGREMRYQGVPFLPVRFNAVVSDGEAFWIPFVHQDGDATWCLLFEAKPGSRMDRFSGLKTGEEVLATSKQVIRDLLPWDADWVEPMTLADANGWLVGAVTPTVRYPVGRLPSGRVVTGVGDTLMSLDPVAGQGANNGTRMAKHLVAAVNTRGDRPFDAAWMQETFETFYQSEGKATVEFNNILLEPMTSAGKVLMMSQYGSDGVQDSAAQRLADRFTDNFDDPRTMTPAMQSDVEARRAVRTTGGSFPGSMLRGLVKVTGGQLRQALGMRAGHPSGNA